MIRLSQKCIATRADLVRLAPLALVLTACTTQDVAVSSGKARFSEYPDSLIAAFQSACEGPSQTFRRPNPDLVECREYLPPDTTGAIILKYDGTIKDLPELVIQFRTAADGTDYVVQNDVFLNVPQKSGKPLQVREQDVRLSRTLNNLYRRAGGVPE